MGKSTIYPKLPRQDRKDPLDYFEIEPQVPGSIWTSSDLEAAGPGESGKRIARFVFSFNLENFDDIFTNSPYYFVTDACKEKLVSENISGISFEQIENVYQDSNRSLGVVVYRMDVFGRKGEHDIFENEDGYSLSISKRTLTILQTLKLDDCPIRPK